MVNGELQVLRRGSVLLLAVASAAPAVSLAAANSTDSIDPELALLGEATVHMENGRSYTGELSGIEDGRLGLVVFDAGGEAEYSLPLGEIDSVRFPGAEVARVALEHYDDRHYDEALPHLEALYRRRTPYLPLLDKPTVQAIALLPRVHLETGALIEAVASARHLLDHFEDAALRRDLETVLLTGYFDLGLHERAAAEARDWCALRNRYPESALGWVLLAEIAMQEERLEDALWIALQPIAFSTIRPMALLDRAYAAAVHAAVLLEEDEKALELYAEMRERRLEWPAGTDRYDSIRTYLEQMLAAAEADGGAPADENFLDNRPAREDLDLPLRHVRKLLLSMPDD